MDDKTRVKSPDMDDRTLTIPACVSFSASWYDKLPKKNWNQVHNVISHSESSVKAQLSIIFESFSEQTTNCNLFQNLMKTTLWEKQQEEIFKSLLKSSQTEKPETMFDSFTYYDGE